MLLDLRLAFLAGLHVRLWRLNLAWHVLLVAIGGLIVVVASILTYAFPLLREIVQFFHYVLLGSFVVKELESLLGMFSLIVDLHDSVFALNVFWVLLNSLLLDVFDLLHVRTLLRLGFGWSCS